MSRRGGQNPSVRIGKRADGTEYYFFQYWLDSPQDRQRKTEVVGLVEEMTKREAERRRAEFILKLKVNSISYQLPSSQTFADAVKHYREEFAPRMLRDSTFIVADGYLKRHLEPAWNTTPIEHITIGKVNEWAAKKRRDGLSWVSVKNILRTMQRVLSAYSPDGKAPFSQKGLIIPERDRLQMQIAGRRVASLSWAQTHQIIQHVESRDDLDRPHKQRYTTLFLLAAASGLRASELLALRMDDLDFTEKHDSGGGSGFNTYGPSRAVQECRGLSHCVSGRRRGSTSDAVAQAVCRPALTRPKGAGFRHSERSAVAAVPCTQTGPTPCP